ncbi:MAG: hypothetical protein JXR03_09605 [Cyclobacteriaceae bacterium]
MSTACHPAPTNKKEYIKNVGEILVRDFGKKRFYKPKEVKIAHRKSEYYGMDFSCWAMSMFSSHTDFDQYHQEAEEICDYTSMKNEMLEGISNSPNIDWTVMSEVDMDSSWLDFGSVFEGIFAGIGEFFSAIADGLG